MPISIIPGIGVTTARRLVARLHIKNTVGSLLSKLSDEFDVTMDMIEGTLHAHSPGVGKSSVKDVS